MLIQTQTMLEFGNTPQPNVGYEKSSLYVLYVKSVGIYMYNLQLLHVTEAPSFFAASKRVGSTA